MINKDLSKSEVANGPVPYAMLIPIFIDVFIYGICIGITSLVSTKSGLLMCIGTAIEVIFLGLMVAVDCKSKNVSGSKILVIYFTCYVLLILGAVVGAALGASIKDSVAYTGLMGFCLTALLWLVIENLKTEAHEGDKKEPMINLAKYFFIKNC